MSQVSKLSKISLSDIQRELGGSIDASGHVRCPSIGPEHKGPDNTSMSVWIGDDGDIKVSVFNSDLYGGTIEATKDEIRRRLGMAPHPAALLIDGVVIHPKAAPKPKATPAPKSAPKRKGHRDSKGNWLPGSTPETAELTDVFPYTFPVPDWQPPTKDAVAPGVLSYETCRIEWPDANNLKGYSKTFLQRRPDPQKPGGRLWNMHGVEPLLYRLPETLEAIREGAAIFVVEGEKAANALWALCIPATTASGGAKAPFPASLASWLKGAKVVLMPDNDEPGRAHMEKVAKALVGVAASIHTLILPNLPAAGDVVDWLAADPKNDSDRLYDLKADATPFVPVPAEPTAPEADWMSKYDRHPKTEAIYQNTSNVRVALDNDPALRGLVTYNRMRDEFVLNRAVPGTPGCGEYPRPFDDDDLPDIQAHLQHSCYLPNVGPRPVTDAFRGWAKAHSFHPIKDYLEALVWDEKERLPSFLSVYHGAANGAYEQAVGTMFLISMVARIYQPGCQCDYTLVLEGKQGAGKSTFCRLLAGEQFSSSSLPTDLSIKDASHHIGGFWLMEFPELASMIRTEPAALKSFLTRRSEKFRPVYKTATVDRPRQCVFVGTTNNETYLRDVTGDRRYWPVKVDKLDRDALIRDRDQLLAEGVHRFKAGEHWWPEEGFEEVTIQPEQSARFEEDGWRDDVEDFVKFKSITTIADVARGIGLSINEIGKTSVHNRLRVILSRIGWVKDGRTVSGRTRWVLKGMEGAEDLFE